MNDDINFLLTQFADERGSHRKREAVLMSVVIHLLAIILIMVGPRLFPISQSRDALNLDLTSAQASRNLGVLALPKDYQKLFQRPKTPVLSDKDRTAQGKSRKINPKGIRAPYSEGDTKLPEQASARAIPQPTPPLSPTPAVRPSTQDSQQQSAMKEEEKNETKPQLPSAAKQESGEAKTNIRDLFARLEAPGASIQGSIEKAGRTGNYGYSGSGGDDSLHRFDNRQPNFSVDQPTILSDTRGVDFGPWLRFIYFRVKDNWYSVIPELIRSRTKGKVVIIFDVLSDGRIENLQVVKSSGLSPYDRAAISSIKLSEPLPNFPSSFSGNHITLQFSYYYNINL
jgi:TonB family protein